MVAELITAPEAAEDVTETYGWYESRRIGLGEEFLNCVDACVEGTRRNPEMYPIVHETYRRALVRRFPYALTTLAPQPCRESVYRSPIAWS